MTTPPWQTRIVSDPNVAIGRPVVKGTRLTVEFIVGLLPQEWSEEEILRNYPRLTREALLACLAYAHERVAKERVYPLSA